MASVFDTAAHLLRESGGTIEQMQLHKILYYCQGWSLGNGRGALFPERIEAWVNGPVVPELWQKYHHRYRINAIEGGNPWHLSADQQSFVDHIFEVYRHYNGAALSQLTHNEEPWLEARQGIPAWIRSTSEITHKSLERYFGGLIAAARGPT